jgi:predicted transcriptional regulator
MGLMKENPRYNVVSIRVSDDELEALQEVSKMTCKSISEVMREAMEMMQTRTGTTGLRCQTSS